MYVMYEIGPSGRQGVSCGVWCVLYTCAKCAGHEAGDARDRVHGSGSPSRRARDSTRQPAVL